MTHLAVGLDNGVVTLFKGDIWKRDRPLKQKLLHEDTSTTNAERITIIELAELSATKFVVYFATPSNLFAVQLGSGTFSSSTTATSSSKDMKKTTLDSRGIIDFGSTSILPETQELVIARPGSLEFYSSETLTTKGPLFMNFDIGNKAGVYSFRNYLIILSYDSGAAHTNQSTALLPSSSKDMSVRRKSDFHALLASSSPDRRRSYGVAIENGNHQQHQNETMHRLPQYIAIYDVKNQLIAFEDRVSDDETGIIGIVTEGSEVDVILNDGHLFRLEEKELATRLNLLCSRQLFTLAITMASGLSAATSANMVIAPTHLVAKLHKSYADHLYTRGDYDNAIQEYIHTIGHVEPSYVIRQFLDAQRVQNLVTYLEALLAANKATKEHVSLLVTSWVRMNHREQLFAFFSKYQQQQQQESILHLLDIDVLVDICRSGGFLREALLIVTFSQDVSKVLELLMEDIHDVDEFLRILRTEATFEECVQAMKRYGKSALQTRPLDTTRILVELCTNWAGTREFVEPDLFMHLFIGMKPSTPSQNDEETELSHENLLVMFLENVLQRLLEEVRRVEFELDTIPNDAEGDAEDGQQHRKRRIGLQRSINLCQARLRNIAQTLLGVYLETIQSLKEAEGSLYVTEQGENLVNLGGTLRSKRVTLERKALALVENDALGLDAQTALVICRLHSFRPGLLVLFEKLGLVDQVLQVFMDERNYEGLIRTCEQHSATNPDLWIQCLRFFGDPTHVLTPNSYSHLSHLLDQIRSRNLLPTVEILRTLSRNESITIGHIRQFLISQVESRLETVQDDAILTKGYQDDCEKYEVVLKEIRDGPVIFNITKCSLCSEQLTASDPTVYFFCKHAYHVHCLNLNATSRDNDDTTCPKCGPEYRLIAEMMRAKRAAGNEEGGEDTGMMNVHAAFRKQMDKSADKLALLADYFAKVSFSI